MREKIRKVKAWLSVENNLNGLVRDLHVYGGLLLAAGGIAAFLPPAAFIVSGVFLAWLGLRVPQSRR